MRIAHEVTAESPRIKSLRPPFWTSSLILSRQCPSLIRRSPVSPLRQYREYTGYLPRIGQRRRSEPIHWAGMPKG